MGPHPTGLLCEGRRGERMGYMNVGKCLPGHSEIVISPFNRYFYAENNLWFLRFSAKMLRHVEILVNIFFTIGSKFIKYNITTAISRIKQHSSHTNRKSAPNSNVQTQQHFSLSTHITKFWINSNTILLPSELKFPVVEKIYLQKHLNDISSTAF